ncbi:RNA polymerase sigma factor [Paenibacillus oralis]|uniref:RNA polymerase sigma factor n=2 Tax=Paenibacillus oralis TaxID=2490856 RepID=A0A3P3U8V0_9BACL|nr:RNA polymerase sigma factor [Paenibacillus oralis]RRJ66136.1 RNA polymerase sigma factor [Paenibacillus oralis]
MREMQLEHLAEMSVSGIRMLMETYGEDVWNYAYVITGNTHTADDVAQDVFIKAYQHYASFRGEASVKTWLLKITRNTALSYQRRAFLRKVVLLGERSPDDGPSGTASSLSSPSAESQYLEREAADELWRQVLKLPGNFRDPLVLSVHHQLSMDEISVITGLTPGTVKSRIHRAKKKLAAEWKGANDHA